MTETDATRTSLAATGAPSPRVVNRVTLAIACSGMAALAFEAVWFRAARWALGGTVWAASATLAAFMLGLAVGGYLALRLLPYLRRPTLAYALAEVVVAVTGALVALLLAHSAPTIAGLLGSPSGTGTGGLMALRFACAFLLMLVPATAMGMTLPLLIHLWRGQPHLAPALGRLYAANTAGGVVGVLAAEWLIVPALGVPLTVAIAVWLSLSAAWIVFASRPGPSQHTSDPDPEGHSEFDTSPGIRGDSGARASRWRDLPWRLMAAAALAGALVLALEVIGFRLLLLQLGGSARDFATMLALVLTGIAAGSWLGRRTAVQTAGGSLAALAGGLAVLAGVGLAAAVGDLSTGWLRQMLASLGLLLPASVASGVLFPLLGERLRQTGLHHGDATARLTIANTAGAGVGALLGALALPWLGLTLALWALVAGYAVLSLILLRRQWMDAAVVVAAVVVAGLAWQWLPPLVDRQVAAARAPFVAMDDAQPVAVRHGVNETAQLLRSDFLGQPDTWRLVTNRYSMSNTAPDSERYMSLFAWWPLALHDAPQDALLISYGLGSTARALLADTRLQRLDVVDTAPETLALSARVHTLDPLEDPRTTTVIDDGRYMLAAGSRRYDIITAEPPPPRISGVVDLYTLEYFQALRARLNAGGVASYWLPVDQLTPNSARAITAAFCNAFRGRCALAAGSHYNWILIGLRDAAAFNQAIWDQHTALYLLRRSGVESPAMLWTSLLADGDQLAKWIGQQPPLSDLHPGRLSNRGPDAAELLGLANWAAPSAARQRFLTSTWVAGVLDETRRGAVAARWDWQPIVNGFVRDAPIALLDGLLDTDLITPVLWSLGSGWGKQRIAAEAEVPTDSPAAGIRAYHLGVGELARRDPAAAQVLFLDALAADVPRARELATYAACRAGDARTAARIAGPAQYAFSCW